MADEKTFTIGARVMISVKAVFAGWLIFLAGLFLLMALRAVTNRFAWSNGSNPFVAWLLVAYVSAFVVFGTWLVVALPMALFVPDRSAFWKPGVLTVVGVVAGPLVLLAIAVYSLYQNPTISNPMAYILTGVAFPGIPSAIIGGVTGAVASHLHARLKTKTES
jgi:hypothetical protein